MYGNHNKGKKERRKERVGDLFQLHSGKMKKVRATNLSNKGLISVDRNNKATLLLTIPRSDLSRLQRICLPHI